VRVVADFRSISEVQDGGKDVLPAKVKGLNLPVGDAAPGTTSTAPAGPPPTEVSADLEAEFRTYVTALEARLSFGAALRTLLVPGVQPLLWHCNSGTFRTGWITAVLHTALGVSKADAYADFLLSNVAFGATYAFAEYLDAAFDEATKTFGSFSGYLRTGLGIDDRTRDRLKASLLA
jgi:protein-tyrosine phosphatase